MEKGFDKLTIDPSTSGSTESASPSVVSSSPSSGNNYFHRRFDGSKRRTELLEKLARNNSPNKKVTTTHHGFDEIKANTANDDFDQCIKKTEHLKIEDDHSFEDRQKEKPQSPPKMKEGAAFRDGFTQTTVSDASFSTPERPTVQKQKPLHLQYAVEEQGQNVEEETSELKYYKIVYRGVVALLSDPPDDGKESKTNNRKTGAYLGYGEIIASQSGKLVEDTNFRIQKRIHGSPRLGSAVDSPILTKVWDNTDQCDKQELPCHTPPRSLVSKAGSVVSSFSHGASVASSIKMRMAIRVDRVLTGGYAFDANEQVDSSATEINVISFSSDPKPSEMTPKRNNIQISTDVVLPTLNSSMLPISDNRSVLSDTFPENGKENDRNVSSSKLGYIFSDQGNIQVATVIPSEAVPKCEPGKYLYRVVSSTPVTILTGPCVDAPKTKAILIPGSVHEVCLRMIIPGDQTEVNTNDPNNTLTFLRLTRRRGWIPLGKMISKRGSAKSDCDRSAFSWFPFMKEIPNKEGDECSGSITSNVTTASIASHLITPMSAASRRHRPPRRKRAGRIEDVLPRHVVGPSLQNMNDTSALTDASTNTSTNISQSHTDPRSIMSPSSNISLLSDDASSIDITSKSHGGPMSPDRSVARSTASSSTLPSFFLMRVNAPRGLKILDAPHFQVNNLIHGSHATPPGISHDGFSASSVTAKDVYGKASGSGNQSIFQTMTGHHTTTMTSKTSNPAIFDSITKARKLPRGSVFEATKRLECSNAFSQGAGLIKLSDNSGWAIIPRQNDLVEQYRGYSGALAHSREGEPNLAFEEVGNSIGNTIQDTIFLRVVSRGGITVSLPPVPTTESDADTSPTSSATGSSVVSAGGLATLNVGVSSDSDVASSVGSSFLDSMFRTPRKRDRQPESINENKVSHQHLHSRPPLSERQIIPTLIPCGTCVEVDRWMDPPDLEQHLFKNEFARIRGGQGWIPRFVNGKPVVETIKPPEFRFGSIWFQVRHQNGIKVRLGPSKRASSIKSDDGVYFRFECGEFLRASEVVTFISNGMKCESYAKLYRNRHVRLHHGEMRPLSSLTAQAEWVQVFSERDIFLDECKIEPRIERHRQGWRYNVVLDARVTVRKGPSFEAETDGVVLLGGESVLVNERVTGPDDAITWLRLKDGHGWVHNVGENGESLMIAHSLRHRIPTAGRPVKTGRTKQEDIAYNTIVARLFHNDVPGDSPSRASRRR